MFCEHNNYKNILGIDKLTLYNTIVLLCIDKLFRFLFINIMIVRVCFLIYDSWLFSASAVKAAITDKQLLMITNKKYFIFSSFLSMKHSSYFRHEKGN